MDQNLQTILESSYKNQRDAEHDLSKLGFNYDNELSSMDTKVFYDAKTKQPHIAYRGSVRASDWLDNINLAFGGKSKQREEAFQTAQRVKDKYGKAPNTYAHSRGAVFAEDAGKLGGNVITYNKATLPSGIFASIGKNQTDYRTSNDLVSLPSIFQSGNKKITIQSPAGESFINAHKISNLNKFKIKR
jgi:hypothetical protein